MKRYLAYAGALAAVGGSANAVYAADGTDDGLTWFGVTLYGTIDIGYTYQNRGAPLSDYFPTGLQYLIQPSNRRSISSVSENGLSQSKIGLRGNPRVFRGMVGRLQARDRHQPAVGESIRWGQVDNAEQWSSAG